MNFFFFIVVIFQISSIRAEVITLTDVDGSYLIHGMRLRKLIQDLTVKADCSDCTIYVQLWANDTKATDFQVKDGALSVSSKDLTARYFGPNVTVDLERNSNYFFALSFTRTTEKSKDAKRDFPHTILVLDTNGSYTSAVKATTTQQAYSYVSPYNQEVFTATVKDLSANCTVDLFLSGIPSDGGRGKYLIYHFNSTTLTSYKRSVVRSPAITYIISPNCAATLVIQTALDDEDKIDHTSSGFMMSPEYPGNFASSLVDSHPSLSLNASWNEEALIGIELIGADPGTDGSLTLFAGDVEFNLTKLLTNQSDFGGLGKQMKIIWTPGNDTKSGFLLRWVVVKDERPSKPKASSIALPIISTIFALFCTLLNVI